MIHHDILCYTIYLIDAYYLLFKGTAVSVLANARCLCRIWKDRTSFRQHVIFETSPDEADFQHKSQH